MAEPRRFLDVWILDPEKVYREVPFTVVVDWVQQGRLLDEDKVRPAGKGEWQRIADSADFAPYILKPEPHRADDQAEAMEPVAVDFVSSAPRRREAEDDDPDMIPLIDVSLVLLIFFMMTAAGGSGINVNTPTTENARVEEYKDGLTIAIDLQGADRTPVYYVMVGKTGPRKQDSNLRSLQETLERIDYHLGEAPGPLEITIDAHEDLKASIVRDLTAELEKAPRRDKIAAKYTGVKGKAS